MGIEIGSPAAQGIPAGSERDMALLVASCWLSHHFLWAGVGFRRRVIEGQMPIIVPSQVVAAIDEQFPNIGTPSYRGMGSGNSPQVKAIFRLADHVPDELINCPSSLLVQYLLARGVMEEVLSKWENGTGAGVYAMYKGKNPLAYVRDAFAACSDEARPPVHASLLFISDEELRDSIRIDIGAAHKALHNGEWKAATVLSGAAIEALLHWRLEREPQARREAVPNAPSDRAGKKPLNRFGLADYISVAEALEILTASQVAAVNLAKDYRNLIHPGRAVRVNQRCTRSTAYVAIGGMEALIEALTAR